MNRVGVVSLGVVVGVLVWLSTRRDVAQSVGSGLQNAFDNGVEYMGQLGASFGFVKMSNAAAVDKSLVNNPNVRAMLRVIREGESSQDDSIAYRMIVGGGLISSFADHPRIYVARLNSTAAGAYQFIKGTWDSVKAKMGLPDFSPKSQDLAALGLIAYRGALPAVLAGDLDTAVRKLRDEWASLPGASQENGDMQRVKRIFVSWGGSVGHAYA